MPGYLPDHLARRVLFCDDEGRSSGYIMVCLQSGWSLSTEKHADVEPFANVTEASIALASVTPCPCSNCRESKALLSLDQI